LTTCKKCGFENRLENNYCARCGAPLIQDMGKNVPKSETKNQMKTVVGIIAFFIIISIISGALWWSSFVNAPGMSQASFTIEIKCDTEWSGAIGGLGTSTTKSGYGDASFTVTSSIVSAVIQKQTDWGSLTVKQIGGV